MNKHTGEVVWRANGAGMGNEDGVMTVLKTGRRKEEFTKIDMKAPLCARPALVGDTLFVVTSNRIYKIASKH